MGRLNWDSTTGKISYGAEKKESGGTEQKQESSGGSRMSWNAQSGQIEYVEPEKRTVYTPARSVMTEYPSQTVSRRQLDTGRTVRNAMNTADRIMSAGTPVLTQSLNPLLDDYSAYQQTQTPASRTAATAGAMEINSGYADLGDSLPLGMNDMPLAAKESEVQEESAVRIPQSLLSGRRSARDTLISEYEKTVQEMNETGSLLVGGNKVLQRVNAAGGIDALLSEQQADASGDRAYNRQLRGVDISGMSLPERIGGTLGNTVKAAGQQIAQSGVGIAASVVNQDITSGQTTLINLINSTAQELFSLYQEPTDESGQAIISGKENALRYAAEMLGGSEYADQVMAYMRSVVNGEVAGDSSAMLDLPDSERRVSLGGLECDPNYYWNSQQEERMSGIYGAMNSLNQSAAESIQYAKDVNPIDSAFGDFLVDAGVSTINSAVDAGVAAALGLTGNVSAMIPFAVRAFGGSYSEAVTGMQELGKSIGMEEAAKAGQYAGLSSAIEVGTEMMWGLTGFHGSVTGGGALDEFAMEKLGQALSGLAKTAKGEKLLTKLGEIALGMTTEGIEEVVGDIANWLLNSSGIYTGEDRQKWDAEFNEELINSFITGALAGLMGETSNVMASQIRKYQVGSQLRNGGLQMENGEALQDRDLAALATDESMKGTSFEKTYEKLKDKSSWTSMDLGKLYNAYAETVESQEAGVQRVLDTVDKVIDEKSLTNGDINRITNNPFAVQYLQEESGVTESFTGSMSERREAVTSALRVLADQMAAEDAQARQMLSAYDAGTTGKAFDLENAGTDAETAAAQLSAYMAGRSSLLENNEAQNLTDESYRAAAEAVGNAALNNRTAETQTVTENQLSAQEAYQNEAEQTGTEVRVREGSQWNDRADSVRSAGVLAEGAVADQGGQAGSVQGKGSYARVSSRSISAETIADTGLRIVTDSPAVSKAREYVESRGMNFVAWSGGALWIDGVQSRGFYDPKTNTVYAREGHKLFTAEQIARHEATHGQIRNGTVTLGSYDGRLETKDETEDHVKVDLATVRDALIDEIGEKKFSELLNSYVELYAGTDLSMQDVFEEMICDAVAGMNEFVAQGHMEDAIRNYAAMQAAQAVTEKNAAEGTKRQAAKAAAKERAGKYSAEIGIGMSDEERANILQGKTVSAPHYNGTRIASLSEEELNSIRSGKESLARKTLARLGEEFGVFRQYKNADMNVEFQFSKGNLRESLHKQSKTEYENYAKLLSVLGDAAENAVGIETHNERYQNAKSNVGMVYVLANAIETDSGYLPVLFEVKEFTDGNKNTLHIAVSFSEIERSRIVAQTPANSRPDALPASGVNIASILSNVNVADKNILKYIPDPLLNNTQLEAKRQAIQETERYIAEKNGRYAKDVIAEKESAIAVGKHLSTNRVGSQQEGLFITEILQNALNVKNTAQENFSAESPVKQEISSAGTSLNQVPALHKDSRIEWGKTNIDIGAGAYEAATEYLADKGVTNLKWDPYNQSESVNRKTLRFLQNGEKADTATCANVLNVIREKDARLNVILQAAKSIDSDGKAYFMVYEGDGSGNGRETSKGWQNNRKTRDYADEIRTYFNDVRVKGKLIVASDVKANLPQASWEVKPGTGVKFSMDRPVEATDRMIALHNMSEEAVRGMLELGGLAMPSVAIKPANMGHNSYGSISAVFGRDSVSPTDRRNRIYNRDAWTPVFPEIGIKISEKASSAASQKVRDLLGDSAKSFSLALDTDNLSDQIERWGSFYKAYGNKAPFKIAFLRDTGRTLTVPMKPVNYRVDAEAIKRLAKQFPKSMTEAMRNDSRKLMEAEPGIRETLRNYYNESGIMLRSGKDEQGSWKMVPYGDKVYSEKIGFGQLDNILRDIMDYQRNGIRKTIDTSRLDKRLDIAMKSKKIQAEYEAWMNDLGKDLVEKRGVRNGKNLFTPSGNRRSFEQLYYEYTLDNIVRAMQSQEKFGRTTALTSTGNIAGATSQTYSSIEEARKDIGKIRDNLEGTTPPEAEAFNQHATELVNALIRGKRGVDLFDASEVLTETFTKARTEEAIYRYLQREFGRWYNVNKDIAHDAHELMKEAQNLPAPYLEGKMYRGVPITEALAYVVPDNMNKELKQQLIDAGANVIEYKHGNDADRLAKVNSVEGAKFSRDIEPYTEKEKTNWAQSKRIVIAENARQIEDFALTALENKDTRKKLYFGRVSEQLAKRIRKETGVNVAGYNLSVASEEIRKIDASHGNEEYERQRGQRAITPSDYMKLPEVVAEFDNVVRSQNDRFGKPVLEFSKELNDGSRITAVGVVSDKHLDLYLQTMYARQRKKSLATPTSDQALVNTPEASSGTALSADNIAESAGPVKGNFSREISGRDMTPEDAYAVATPVQRELNRMLQEISDELGFPYSDVTQKSLKSIRNKVQRKIEEGKDYSVMDMKDHTRSNVMMDEWADIPAVLDEFDSRSIPYETEAVETPWGYKGFHVTWRNEDGITSEVQLTTKDHWELKKWSDEIYDKWRNEDFSKLTPERQIEFSQDKERSIERWNQAEMPGLKPYLRKSLAVMERASYKSSPYMGEEGATQTPSTNSRIPSPVRMGERSNTLPSSVTQKSDIAAAPFNKVSGTSGDNDSITGRLQNGKASRELSSLELLSDYQQLKKDYDELRQVLKRRTEQKEYWKGQTRVTKSPTLVEADVKRLAKDLIKSVDSRADAAEVTQKIKALGEKMLANASDSDSAYMDARQQAYEIAHDILNEAYVLQEVGDEIDYREFKNRLKNTRIYVPQSVRSDLAPDGWQSFRRSMFGPLTMTSDTRDISIDRLYQSFAEEYGDYLFPEDVYSEADQLERIIEVLEDFKPVYEHLGSADMAEAVEWTASEIMTRIISEEVRQTNPTYADKMEQRLKDQKTKANEALKKVREQRDRKIEALKAHYREVAEDKRARKLDSEMRTRLLKVARRVNNMKLPRIARQLLDQYIGDLDLVAKGITGRTVANLEGLQAWYSQYAASMGDDFIPDKTIEKKLARLSKRHISDLSQEEVADLTTVLLNFENEIRTRNKLIDSQLRMDRYAAALQTVEDIENSRGNDNLLGKYIVTETLSPEREVHRITGYVDSDPLYQLTKELSDGQRKQLDYQLRAEKLFTKWTNDKKFTQRIAGKKAETIIVKGIVNGKVTDVVITPAMRMSLYLHEKNDDNMTHIAKGGVIIPNMELYRKGKLREAYNDSIRVVFTRSMVKEIAAGMSEKERAFANAASKYFNGMSRDAINEVSEQLKGYSIAGVENYFPIDTEGAFLKKEFDAVKRDGSVEGMGMLKERQTGASNPIRLYDMNSVLMRSIGQHAKYYGIAIPVRNINKLYGVNIKEYDGSIKKALNEKYSSGSASQYIGKMMADVQNGTALNSDSYGELLAKMRSRYAGAVLELNASVAFKQAASYPTAAAVVGYGPLSRALSKTNKKNVDLELVEKYTPLLWYRRKGFSTLELGDIGKEGKSLPKYLNWIQGIDVWTTRKLWLAAEYYVQDNNKALTTGTDAYYQEVARIYNRIIEETQPNYTMMQRPQVLRSSSDLTRALNMFKTQPFQNFNILYDAFGNLAAKSRQYKAQGTEEALADLKAARKNAVRAVSSQAASAFVFSLMQYAWDGLRGKAGKYHDDDDEWTLLTWLKGMGLNTLSSVGGMIPFGSAMLELAEALTDGISKVLSGSTIFDQTFYGLSETSADSFNDMGNALISLVTKMAEVMKSESIDESTIRSLVSGMENVAQFGGIPAGNVIKLAQMIARNVFLAADGKYLGGYKALRLTTDPSKYSSDYYNLLYKAYLNDRESYEEIYRMMTEQSPKKRDGSELKDIFTESSIKSAIEKRMKLTQGVDNVKDLEERWMSPSQKESYTEGLAGIEKSVLWTQATDDQQQKVLTSLYNITIENDAGERMLEKISGGSSVGLDQTEYLLFTLALSMVDEPNASGTMGTYSVEEAEEAIRMLTGLSDEERTYLWTLTGKKESTSPWK